MPETVNGGKQDETKPPKEMSMEVRLLLAFLLMGAVMFLTPYFLKTPPPAANKATPAGTTPVSTAPASPATALPQTVEPSGAPSIPATPQQVQPSFIVDTDVYRIAFSNQGATVRSWVLKKYKNNDGKPLELVNTTATTEFPFSLYFPEQKPTANVNFAYFTQSGVPDGIGVRYQFSDGHTSVKKEFLFQQNTYLAQVTTEVTVDGKPVPHAIEWRGGFGDLNAPNEATAARTLYFDQAENKLVERSAKDAKNGPITATGNFSFVGVADLYFAAVYLPETNDPVTAITFSDTVRTPFDEKPAAFPGVAVSTGSVNRFSFFVGPKDLDILKRVNPKLVEVVSFGWMAFLAKPLFLVVNWMNDSFVHNFGWAIVLITVIINIVLFPLRLTQMKSAKKMQALKPQIDALNEKYKGISMRDPKAANKQQEQMDLYKKNGVNPMGGCLPSIIQLALIWPFYTVFRVAVEMRGASWLWVGDLSQPEHLPIKMLPIILIVTQFLTQKMMPAPSTDPNQARMMMLMPLVFGFMFYQLPSGLVLYYLTSNLVMIGQTWFFNHTHAAEVAAQSVTPPPKKKNGRK
ncbi:MAG TPA: membrane protein insertase YidC [Bryobacteraceae bacterium]|jgi:YidC/Oxa1 family membrane protein insertase|nr:membrane protein insertase YidC [Bryobacteraceae bacterium]